MTPKRSLHKEDWFVRSIPSWEARKLVQDHHYSRDFAGSLDPMVVHGLVRRTEGAFGRPWGVAIWYGAVFALRRYGPVLQLSRLVCIPEAPGNAASFLLRHSMGLIDAIADSGLVAATPVSSAGQGDLRALRAAIESRLEHGLRHIPGTTKSEERQFNDGQAFGLRYALERIDAALATQPSSDVVGAPSDDDNEEDGDGR